MLTGLLKNLDKALTPLWASSSYLFDITLLTIRLYMANIFLKSGLIKLQDIMDDNFERVELAFTDFHPIPGIDPTLAAIGATAGELILPFLLGLGFMGRLGALGLMIMTLLIEFAVPAEYEISNAKHYIWMMLLAAPLFHGMGRLSIDYWVAKSIRGQ